MSSKQSVEQGSPEISVENGKGVNSLQEINSGQTADDKPISTESNVNKITSIAGTEKLQQSSIEVGACTDKLATSLSVLNCNVSPSVNKVIYFIYLFTFKLEKPKLPVFAGNVRDYAIFPSDFKHAIEAKYSKRDSIKLLRTCVRDKPLELIKGIESNYDATWLCLSPVQIFFKRSFCYSGVNLWNSLPSNVRAIRSYTNFRNEIDRRLSSSYSHTANM